MSIVTIELAKSQVLDFFYDLDLKDQVKILTEFTNEDVSYGESEEGDEGEEDKEMVMYHCGYEVDDGTYGFLMDQFDRTMTNDTLIELYNRLTKKTFKLSDDNLHLQEVID